MKPIIRNLLAAILFAASPQTHAQGTLVYDQQSATGPVPVIGNGNADGLNIQEDSTLMQSFISTLSTIGFVQLEFEDVPNNGTEGASVVVALYGGSQQSPTFLGSTAAVYMPNGFANNGLAVAGIATFFFSTPVTLTPGQTYYLSPFVLPGSDNPWDIVTIGNTYANGQLYENGYAFDHPIDFWFREGVASVPESSTLALFGLGGLLIFCRRRCRAFLVMAGLLISPLAHAQVYYLQSFGGVGSLPYPSNPYGDSVPVEIVSPGIYLVEDGRPSGGGFHAMDDSGPLLPGEGGGSGTNGGSELADSLPVYTNGLWLENLNEGPSNLSLRLHGTAGGDNYQLLSTTNTDLRSMS